MSPEQALGLEIDFRSDIYSMGVVAYSLVCGELPFTGKSGELMEFHRSGNPVPPASTAKVPRDYRTQFWPDWRAILPPVPHRPSSSRGGFITPSTPSFSHCEGPAHFCCSTSSRSRA